jgi:transmembrane sensor
MDRIVELITGNVAEEQKNDILNHLKEDAQLRNEFSSVKNAWALSCSKTEMSELKVERSYLDLKSKIENQRPTVNIRIYTFLKYAAILLVFFGAGILSNKYLLDFYGKYKTSELNLTEIVVPSGQIAEVNLPDGSHVWLNAQTRLSFSKSFSEKNREISLKGEAFFNVQKGEKPFVVSTKFGKISVLGTSFNVRAFENSEFQTTLVEGVVRYQNTELNKTATLSPGQQLALHENKEIDVHEVVNTNVYTSWKDGIIIFEKEPLREVIKRLERHFSVKIVLDDQILGEMRFTGRIENESMFDVLNYINKTKQIQYTFDKRLKLLTIRKK